MPTALIVGAGIGGLAAGLALRRAGWDIRIFERAPAPRELGFGLGLAANAIAALRELGVADAVVPRNVTPLAAEIRHIDGRVIRRFAGRPDDLPPGDLPGVILRPVLHGALLDAIGPDAVVVNRAAVGYRIEGDAVHLELSDGSHAAGAILIGADGVASTIRSRLHPTEPPPRPSGYIAIRGVSYAIERLNGLNALWYFGRGVESGVVQASANAIYWFVSLVADGVRSGPSDVASVMQRCTSGFDRQFHAITGATAPGDLRLDELLERDPLPRWGDGPVTLLGDAAHPMLPFTGQGAAQALEDAVGLGRALRNHGDVTGALRRYEDVRARRAHHFVRLGPRLGRLTTTRNPLIGAFRNAAIRLAPMGALLRGFMERGPDPNRELGEPHAPGR